MKKFKIPSAVLTSGFATQHSDGYLPLQLDKTLLNKNSIFRFPIRKDFLPIDCLFIECLRNTEFNPSLCRVQKYFTSGISDEVRVREFGENYPETITEYFKKEGDHFIRLCKEKKTLHIQYTFNNSAEPFNLVSLVDSILKGTAIRTFSYPDPELTGSQSTEPVISMDQVMIYSSYGFLAYQNRILILLVLKDPVRTRLKLRLATMNKEGIGTDDLELWVDTKYLETRTALHASIDAIIRGFKDSGIAVIGKPDGINPEFYFTTKDTQSFNQILNTHWYNDQSRSKNNSYINTV